MYCYLLWWRALKRAIILLLLLLVVACAPHFAVAVGAAGTAGTAGTAGGSLVVADLADVEADCPMMEVVHETLAAVISLRIADPEKVKWNAAAAAAAAS